MKVVFKRAAQGCLAVGLLAVALTWDGEIGSVSVPTLTSPAQAVVGRPLTPVSYAGVARRTTRRAVAVTAAATPPPPPPTVVVVETPAPAPAPAPAPPPTTP